MSRSAQSIDYRALLAGVLEPDARGWSITPEGVLNTHIPDLCPDCKGGGTFPEWPFRECTHPNAPTIADRLALADRADRLISLATTAVAWSWPGLVGTPEDEYVDVSTAHDAARTFLAALRTEADHG